MYVGKDRGGVRLVCAASEVQLGWTMLMMFRTMQSFSSGSRQLGRKLGPKSQKFPTSGIFAPRQGRQGESARHLKKCAEPTALYVLRGHLSHERDLPPPLDPEFCKSAKVPAAPPSSSIAAHHLRVFGRSQIVAGARLRSQHPHDDHLSRSSGIVWLASCGWTHDVAVGSLQRLARDPSR